jgi:hypothetical protein
MSRFTNLFQSPAPAPVSAPVKEVKVEKVEVKPVATVSTPKVEVSIKTKE